MSKKFDDYIDKSLAEASKISYPATTNEMPNFPVLDDDLKREIRDKAIINYVIAATKSGKVFTYGDILALVDHDNSEKEYENSKVNGR